MRPVSNKRRPLSCQKQISAPGAKSNHYGILGVSVTVSAGIFVLLASFAKGII